VTLDEYGVYGLRLPYYIVVFRVMTKMSDHGAENNFLVKPEEAYVDNTMDVLCPPNYGSVVNPFSLEVQPFLSQEQDRIG
jgi:hypothetical protein